MSIIDLASLKWTFIFNFNHKTKKDWLIFRFITTSATIIKNTAI